MYDASPTPTAARSAASGRIPLTKPVPAVAMLQNPTLPLMMRVRA